MALKLSLFFIIAAAVCAQAQNSGYSKRAARQSAQPSISTAPAAVAAPARKEPEHHIAPLPRELLPAQQYDSRTSVPYIFSPAEKGYQYIQWSEEYEFSGDEHRDFIIIHGTLNRTNVFVEDDGSGQEIFAKMKVFNDSIPDILKFIDTFERFTEKLNAKPDLADGAEGYYKSLRGRDLVATIVFSRNKKPMLSIQGLGPEGAGQFTEISSEDNFHVMETNPHIDEYLGLSLYDVKAIKYILTELKDKKFKEYLSQRESKARQQDKQRNLAEKHRELDALFKN
ncbi:MAG: hypothetical protein JWQ71_1309 [Pedosphaera sp.]|nr:hypothetical protein [Pedosphaera sp.]